MKKFTLLFVLSIILTLNADPLEIADYGQSVDIKPGFSADYIEYSQSGLSRFFRTMDALEYGNDMFCRLDTAAVDIVFAMDTSGSMGPIIDRLRTEISGFVTELEVRRYDYHLGGVTFENTANVWDFDGGIPGNQMTDDATVFETWLASTGEAPPVAERWEVSLDAIADAINLYDWRPEAVHVIIMFTNEGSHYLGDGDGHADETFSSVHTLLLGSGTVLFVNAESRPAGTGSPIPAEHLDSMLWIAEESGGEFFSDLYPVTFDPVLDAVLDLLDTYVAIGAEITNNTGSACVMNAFLIPNNPACVRMLSPNPVSSTVSVPVGAMHYFSWQVTVDSSSCSGAERCFTLRLWGCGEEDTIYGCTTDDSCFGYTDIVLEHPTPLLTSSCLEVRPNPVPMSFTVTNDGIRPATEVVATLSLAGSALTLAGGDANPFNIGVLDHSGDNHTLNWNINIPEAAYGTEQCYVLTVTHAEGPPVVDTFCIDIPDLHVMPTVTAESDPPVICAGECANLSATHEPDTMSLSYSWTPTTGLTGAGTATPTACPSTTTTYTVTVTDGDDCIATDEVTVEVAPPITADAGEDQQICGGGSATIGGSPTGSGGYGALSYSWNPTTGLSDPTSPNPSVTISTMVTYQVTVTDEAGCEAIDEVTVTISPEITADAGPDHLICEGESITIGGSPTGDGGYGDLTYSWSPATGLSDPTSPNPVATPSTDTEYIVTVTDEFDCEMVDTVLVEISPEITVDAGRDTTLCEGEAVTIGGSPTATGGTAPLTYSWSPATGLSSTTNPNPEADPTTTTTYTVTVTDDAGCEQTDEVTITISPEMTADAGDPADICSGESVTLGGSPVVTGGTGPYTYSWTPTAGLSDPTSPNPEASPSGTETYSLTVTDAYGCVATDIVTITIGAPIVVDPGSGEIICEGESIILGGSPTGSGGYGTLRYSWSPTTGLSDPTSPNPEADPTVTTTYTVTVTDDLDCFEEATVTVTVSPEITANAGTDDIICLGESIAIGGSPTGSGGTDPLEYSWTPATGLSSTTSPNPTATPTVPTEYIVTVTDAAGCTDVDTVFIDIAPVVIADAGPDEIVCDGETWELGGSPTGSGGYGDLSYSWSPTTGLSDPTSPNPDATPTSTTTYTVTVTDELGCLDEDDVTITISPDIIADAGSDTTICLTHSWTLGGSPTGTGGTGTLSYSWTPTTGLSDPNSSNPTASPTTTTTYTVTVTDIFGCFDEDDVTVTIAPEIVVDAGPDDTLCEGETVILGGTPTASGGIGDLTYSWTPTAGLSDPTSPNPEADPAMTTTYTVTVTDSLGCVYDDDVTVVIAPPVVANAGPVDSICAAEAVTLGGSPTGSGGLGSLSYYWEPAGLFSDPTLPNPAPRPDTTSQYIVSVTDAAGCVDYDTVVITVAPPIVINLDPPDTICEGSSTTLGGSPTATGGLGDLTYSWTPTTGLSDPSSPNPIADPTVSTTYTLTVTDELGCFEEQTIVLTVSPTLTADAGEDDTLCYGETGRLGGTPTASGGIPGYTYLWTPATGLSDPAVSNPDADPLVNTEYIVTVTDIAGCVDIDTVYITVSPEIIAEAGEQDTICEGSSVDIGGSPTGSGGTGDLMYEWTPMTTVDNPYDPNPNAFPTTTTTYRVTITDELGCVAIDSVTIVVSPELVVDAGPGITLCPGEEGSLGIPGGITGGIEPYTIEWTPTDGLTDPDLARTGATPDTTTTYMLRVTDVAGCSDSDFVTIEVSPETFVDAGNDTVLCAGESIELGGDPTGSGGYGSLVYSWSPSSTLDDPSSPNPTATPLDTTVYIVTVVDGYGCVSSDTIVIDLITVPSQPELVSPPNGTMELVPPTVLLDWEESDGHGPITYDLYVQGELEATGLTETEYTYEIECDSTYLWHVVAVNSCGESVPSEAWTFATIISPLPPMLISPVNMGSVRYPGDWLCWHTALGGSPMTYELYIDGVLEEDGLTDTCFYFPTDCDNEHTWYVGARNICDIALSPEWTFYTPESAEPPVLIHPPHNDTIPPPATDLIWHSVTGTPPIRYDVYINDSLYVEDLTDTTIGMMVECDQIVNWYVVAKNTCGEWDSDEWRYYTPQSPSPPELISPYEGETVYLPMAECVWHRSEGTEPIVYDFYLDGSLRGMGMTDTSITFPIDCEFEYEWYVVARNLCGEVPSETWTFPSQDCGAPIARIVQPIPGSWSACPDQNIVIYLFDSLGITEERIDFYVNDVHYELDDPQLTYSRDTLRFVPDPLWEDGDSIFFHLDPVPNTYGAYTAPLDGWFRVDLSPPYVLNFDPTSGDTIMDPFSTISFDIYDTLSGLDDESIEITIDGVGPITLDSAFVSFDGEHLIIDLEDAEWELPRFRDFDICISAHDDPYYCDPNEMEVCFPLYVYGEGPVADIIEPLPNTYSACEDQGIIMVITDPEGIDPSTILLSVDGDTFDISDDELSFASDTLIWTPGRDWDTGDIVEVTLIEAMDIYGYGLDAPITWSFTIDIAPPVVLDTEPDAGDVIADSLYEIEIVLFDSLSGLDPSSVLVTIDGVEFAFGDFISSFDGDSVMTIRIPDHIAFAHNDTVEVCVESQDSPDYCAANEMEHCFSFYVDLLGPEIGTPVSGGEEIGDAYSACDDQGFCIDIHDSPVGHGIDETSIRFTVNGTVYSVASPEVSWSAPNLCFDPEPGTFTDSDTVNVSITVCNDVLGNPLVAPFSFSYIIDLSPPYIASGSRPLPGTPIGTLTPRVRFPLTDDLAGVMPESTEVCVEVFGDTPVCFSYPHAGLTFDDDYWWANFAEFGLDLAGGDTIRFCVGAADGPDFCTSNTMDTCWVFYIPEGSPLGEILEPEDGTYSACDDQGIHMRIFDIYGIDATTIELEVNGVIYTTADPELTFYYDSDSLVWLPPDDWDSGDVIDVTLLDVVDSLDNHLEVPISWSFTIDLMPPVLTGFEPPLMSWVTDTCPTVTFELYDSLSGLDDDEVIIRADGISATLSAPGITWDDPEVTIDLCAFGAVYNTDDTVEICIEAPDSPDYCAANVLDTCMSFMVTVTGPHGEIITPLPGVTTACDPQQITVLLTDEEGVDPATVILAVDSVEYRVSDPELTLDGDTLTFDGGSGFFTHGATVLVELRAADDIDGRPLMTPLSWSFTVDLLPPELDFDFPGDGAIVGDLSPLMSFWAWDDLSGVDLATIELTVDGITYVTTDAALTYSGDSLFFDPDVIPLAWEGGDTIEVCLVAGDSPTDGYCDPNATTACWQFSIVAGGPEAELITPADGSVSACDPQEIRILLTDDDGLLDESIILSVMGVEYTLDDPELFWEGDTLVFDGGAGVFPDGDMIEVELVAAEDIYHNPLMTPISTVFYVDYSPPVLLATLAGGITITNDADLPLNIHFIDSTSGIDHSSVIVTLMDTDYTLSALTYTEDPADGSIIIDLTHAPFEHNDTVEICITAGDSPDYCPPNEMSECHSFVVDLIGPAAGSPLTPEGWEIEDVYSSCDDQGFCFPLADVEVSHGVDDSSIVLEVAGREYTIVHPALSYSSGHLCFEPGAIFDDGEFVEVSLIAADDSLGNPLSLGLDFSFTVDLTPPVLSGASPIRGAIIGTLTPDVTFSLSDMWSGVDYDSVEACINAPSLGTLCYTLDDFGFSHVGGGNYIASFSDLGLELEGGDNVRFCVTAYDNAVNCGANELDTCWRFYIPPEGPLPIIIEPEDSTWSACSDQGIYMYLYDTTGIVEETIELEVNGILYTTADPELSFFYLDPPPDSLVWLPPVDWTSGETVNVRLLSAEDSIGNTLDGAPVEWSFRIDLEPPVLTGLSPAPESLVADLCPVIDFGLYDDLSGLNESRLFVEIEGDTVTPSSMGVTWTGDHFTLDLCDYGMFLSGGDTVNVCIYSEDSPDYCAANRTDTCWYFIIEGGGPEATIITPFDGAYSACDPAPIAIYLFDEDGIMEETIRLLIDGVEYTTDDPELSFISDTLIFDGGEGFFADGETVHVVLDSADDMLRNPLATVIDFTFILDYSSPVVTGISPVGEISSLCPDIYFDVEDMTSGLDDSTMTLTIAGMTLGITDPSVSWDGMHFSVNLCDAGITIGGGDSVTACIHAGDMPDICPPNVTDTCFTFIVSPGGPDVTILNPGDGTYSACDPQEIRLLVTDPDGVDSSSIVISIDGIEYTLEDSLLYMSGDTLIFDSPVGFFGDGDLIEVILTEAEDMLHNPIDAPVSFSFYLDYSAPVFWDEFPADMGIVRSIAPLMGIHLHDSLSGIDPAFVTIEIDGVTYSAGDGGFALTGDSLSFDPTATGLSWEGGDTVRVTVTAWDSPDYCDPNEGSFSWSFVIPEGGPIPEIITPLDSMYSACTDQRILLLLFDPDGVDESTVTLDVNGTVYNLGSSELSYVADTLIFDPGDGFWSNVDTVTVTLLSADDMLGNPSAEVPLEWTYFVDLNPPVIDDFQPAYGSNPAGEWQHLISAQVIDDMLGVNPDSLIVSIYGIYRATDTLHMTSADAGLTFAADRAEIDPSAVDETAFGITYLPHEDTLAGGIWLPETFGDDIDVTIRAIDNEPDLCEGHEAITTFAVNIPDDDTLPPTFLHMEPPFLEAGRPYLITLEITDFSNVWDTTYAHFDGDSGVYLQWWTNSQPDTHYLEMDPTSAPVLNPDMSWTVEFATVDSFRTTSDDTILYYRAVAYDADWDFSNPIDRTRGVFDHTVNVMRGPDTEVLNPWEGASSSCLDQSILIDIRDREGVDTSTIVLHIFGEVYTLDHPWLSYHDTLLAWVPDVAIFENNDHVTGFLEPVADIYGNWSDTVFIDFYIDVEAPVIEIVEPPEGAIVSSTQQNLTVHITDNLAGIRIDSLRYTINGEDFIYPAAGLVWDSDGPLMGDFTFMTEMTDLQYLSGDTVYVSVFATDNPDIDDCGVNASEISWWFTLEAVECAMRPNPFTPNTDGYNDIVAFSYPKMFSEDAKLQIFDKRKQLIFEREMPPIGRYIDFDTRIWDGRDTNGKDAKPGVYFYIISRGGEVICEGTVVLVR